MEGGEGEGGRSREAFVMGVRDLTLIPTVVGVYGPHFILGISYRNFVDNDLFQVMEEYMERPRGEKIIYTADGHRLCTSHRRKGLYG